MSILLLGTTAVVFAIGAIRARKLLGSAIWLAGVSALLAIIFYIQGARQVAVIELSVGAGLVTVLFVFAISISGEDDQQPKPVLPTALTMTLILLFAILMTVFLLISPTGTVTAGEAESTLAEVIWQQRGMDVLVQVVLIFSVVLGLLTMLAESRAPLDGSAAAEMSAHREEELKEMENRILGDQENQS